jgi:hypothetical protein
MTYDKDGVLGFVASSAMTRFAVFGLNPDNYNPNANAPIPEPSMLSLLGLGCVALLQQRRR